MVKSKKYVLLRHFEGNPKRSDFEIVDEELPPLGDNEVLVEAEYISVDPAMRIYPKLLKLSLPIDMFGSQVGRILESKHKDFPVGRRVLGQFGWRTLTIFKPDEPWKGSGRAPSLVPDLGGLPSSLALGILGMPGNSAYFGFVGVCKPKPGEVVVVTGAAGAIGSLVGQIAKIKGCKVIGLTSSEDKCKWLTEELGFDVAINYKTTDVESALKEAAPDGIDCFFDNVGGESATVITKQLRYGARVSLCGFVSGYGAEGPIKVTSVNDTLIVNEVTVKGFYVYAKQWTDRWDEGIAQTLKWIKEGKVKYNEHVTDGFDNIVDGFVGMLRGDNFGKAVIKL